MVCEVGGGGFNQLTEEARSKGGAVGDAVSVSRHMLSYMPKTTRILFHLAVICDSLKCGAYGSFCCGIL